jgi:hypothetical protein
MNYPEIEITKEDLRRIIYFILMKFKGDPLHRQGTSAKRDLIGGYIERWFNKIAETIIFDKLLEHKTYKVVSDYFIYANDSDKNAPDILGLQKDEKTIPFVKYNNGTWQVVSDMPRIEVKVVRKDQAMVSVREPQMIDDYYAFIESDLDGDYLTSIFEKAVFDDKYFEELKMSSEFIKNDVDNQIIPHNKVIPSERIGTMRLIGIYTQDELRDNSVLCGKDVSPYYFGTASNKSPAGKIRLNQELTLDQKGRFVYKFNDNYICLPVAFANPNNAKITILKQNKGSVYLNSTENISVGGIFLSKGDILVEFKKFDRSSKWEENILLKQTLEKYGKDSAQELIYTFDQIVKE